jgi:branched-chain amino acid transport system ATP-binding protein
MSDAALRVQNVTKQFGSLTAIQDVSIDISDGDITAIIGPNGAGKTTLFNMLTGKYSPTGGEIWFEDKRIDEMEPSQITDYIARSYQVTNFFPELTALENVRLAAQANDLESSGLKTILTHHRDFEGPLNAAKTVLERVDLLDVQNEIASNLSHGQQRHLEIGIALASDPDVLLLDEPTAGMSPSETDDVIDLFNEIATDVTLVLIEHDMEVVTGIADRIAVINNGKVVTIDSPEEVMEDEEVQQVYLEGGHGR